MTGFISGQIRSQPRLAISFVTGIVVAAISPGTSATRLLLGWDVATGLYLLLAVAMMARSDIKRIRVRAARQDDGQNVLLALITITDLVSLVGVVVELSAAKAMPGHRGVWHVALAASTVFLSWNFLHTMFALHYAHLFYAVPEPGLDFPGHEPPDYWDFMYYSFVIGTASATADINVTGRTMRRITGVHCVVAFFFNTTILALMVNIGAGFF